MAARPLPDAATPLLADDKTAMNPIWFQFFQIGKWLPLAGGTMTGPINMGGNSIVSDAGFAIKPNLASVDVDTYGAGSPSGKTAIQIINSDGSALTGKERYSAWIGNTSAGTGDGTVAGATFALGISAIKANWTATTVAGQTCGINVVVRGGDNNVVDSGDVTGYIANAGASYANNYVASYEATSGYFPAGSTTGSIYIRNQIGPIRATGIGDVGNNSSAGFFAQASNSIAGAAFLANNLKASPAFGNPAAWTYFLKYDYDDGTHAPYTAFSVNATGGMILAGFGAVGTNQKTLRVGGSSPNNFEIVNAASSALIFSMTDTGFMFLGPGSTAANGAVATVMSGVGPAGSHTAIQEWFTFQNSGGVTRYVPAF